MGKDHSESLPIGTDYPLEERRAELVRKILEGIDSLDRGEGIPSEFVAAKLNAKIASLKLKQ